MGKSTYLSNEMLDHVLRGAAYSAPASVYLALFTDMTGVEESGTLTNELSGNGYARKQITGLPAASSGQIASDAAIYFDPATGDWDEVVGWAIMDAASGGNVLYAGTLTIPRTFLSGDTPYIAAGALIVSET